MDPIADPRADILDAVLPPARGLAGLSNDMPRLRLGIDLCSIEPVAASLARFGRRYLDRIYTPDEAAYAMSAPALAPERLAARFAAKEAAIKAFGLGQLGVAWTDLEVRRTSEGACTLALHGRAAAAAAVAPGTEVAVSLSHDGGQAAAVVLALA